MHDRVDMQEDLTGRGDIDLLRLIRTLGALGAGPAVLCEVYDEQALNALGVAEFAIRQVEAARSTLAAARD
jgi:hypothetical protein